VFVRIGSTSVKLPDAFVVIPLQYVD